MENLKMIRVVDDLPRAFYRFSERILERRKKWATMKIFVAENAQQVKTVISLNVLEKD